MKKKDEAIRLTIELVPGTCFYVNVRSQVKNSQWDRIRKKSYRDAGYVCQICGDNGLNQGLKHPVECHEIWHYDDENRKQTLTGFISLCPSCHTVKHPGLAKMRGHGQIVIDQLMKVNGWKEKRAKEYIAESFKVWSARSKQQWETDLSLLTKEYGIIPEVIVRKETFHKLADS